MDMQRSLIYSAGLHVVVALLIIFGLPDFFERKVIDQPMMIVEMVQIAEKTNPPPSQAPREQPKPTPAKPVEDKPPPPQAKPIPTPPPVPEPPKPQVAETPPEPLPKPPEPLPKPEVKPEVKKEPPPPKETATPPPPQQLAKIVPPKKPPPKRDDFINSILKDVAPTPRAEQTDQKPVPQKNPTPPSPSPPSLDQQITMSEIDAVRRQISECWSLPAGARDAKDLIVTIHATVAPDGRVSSARIESTSRLADPYYRAAAESAQRAMLNPRCQPLKLPPHKYDQWKTLILNFNPKDLIG